MCASAGSKYAIVAFLFLYSPVYVRNLMLNFYCLTHKSEGMGPTEKKLLLGYNLDLFLMFYVRFALLVIFTLGQRHFQRE